jgi:lysosomal alpha-mannosidase
VGPVPLADGVGKEVVVRYSTGLASGGRWLTDSNGRELLERTRDHRPHYALNLTEPQAANMHPIQTAIAVRKAGGGGAQLTVTPDRSQAGTSLVDGQLELLLHRRLV